MKLPRICHVHPSFGTGGPEVRTSLLIDASAGRLRHTVVSLSGCLDARARIQTRDDVEFIDATTSPGIRALARRLRAIKPDLVVTNGWGGTDALLAARIAGLPVLHAEDGFLPDEAHRQKRQRLLARRILLRLPRRVVCPSRTLVRIANEAWRLPAAKVHYIPNGVDAEGFRPGNDLEIEEARRRVGCREGELVVGTVGRLSLEKNQGRLLRAFAGLAARRPARLILVGDGPLRERLLTEAAALGIGDRLRITGWSAQTSEFYRAMDVFALTSDTEQMPIVLLEAMATGLPVVATDVGDVATMVASENRPHVVPAHRESELAESLLSLAEQPSERERLGVANRRRCEDSYTLESMIEAHLSLYRDHLGRDE